MPAEAHAAIDIVAAVDRVGLEEAWNRRGGRDRDADRYVTELVTAEHDALGTVEVDRRDQEGALELREGVPEPALVERLPHEALERLEAEEPRGEIALGVGEHVGHRAAHPLDRALADSPDEATEASGGVTERVRGVDRVAPEVQRVVEVVVDDAEEVGGSHTVGEERGDDGPRTAADVDVEAAVAVQPLLQGGDRADLVHATDDTPASQGQRRARPLPGPTELFCALDPFHAEFHPSKLPASPYSNPENTRFSHQLPLSPPLLDVRRSRLTQSESDKVLGGSG